MRKYLPCILLLVCLLVSTNRIKAQVPGYLGKRVSVGYRLYTNPGFSGTPNFNTPDAERIYLHTRHHLEIDLVTSRKSSIGLNAGWCRNGIKHTSPFTQQVTHITAQSLSAGIHFRFFPFLRKGNIAPLGPYTEFQVAWCNFMIKNPEGDYFQDGNTDLGSRGNLNLSLAWGRNYLVKEALLLSYGIQGGMLLGLGGGDLEYYQDVTTRMSSSYRINIHIGVGGLLF